MVKQRGIVYFVGAGPGDPKLITVRGAEVLKLAEVIVYDRLVNRELLQYASKEAKLIYCGKTPSLPSVTQEEINSIIVSHGKRGKTIVRLKGGDPTIFGRVGEEAEQCVNNDIPYEIIPGITSGIAAPAYAGIPLTHRDLSASLAIVTGHQRNDGKEREINWRALATGIDTVVFYMGVNNLSLIQKKLIEYGRNSKTPVALIQWGTLDKQRTLVGTLSNIQEQAVKENFKSPAIIVIGEVVSLKEKLAWFEEKSNPEALLNEAVNL
ncbi:uroporphyrinogen-III C-methyltransferase [Evansella sp. AB-P1]|uniref:uroporphyrinogen-III C-methyltransferase n=1 Tax=Evansella sp. AB-P1 TaxID=3037653 RepID=UPI00241C385C|nr:uroporphyrinogen-III C-methyltransferase [Evansella sp. AB-P1]MDG5787834.1 uroporphyrinogen-III C-methyltransferase [Evansella sp. AB-P1]